jgi:hypothetical protein
MKKIITLVSLLIIALPGFSQITINESDLPVPGSSYITYDDQTDTAFLVTAASSTAQQWNYAGSFKTISDTDYLDYQNAATAPYYNLFPDATVALDLTPINEFFQSTSSGFYLVGYHNSDVTYPFDSLVIWSPTDLLVPVPLTYDDSRSYTAKSVVGGYNPMTTHYDRFVAYVTGDYYSDAFGSITTPGGSYPDVLRVQKTEEEYDTTYGSDTQNGTYTKLSSTVTNYLEYYFVGNAPDIEIMEIDLDATTMAVTDAKYTINVATGINKSPAKSPVFTNVFPNPAHASAINFNIEGAQGHQLKIYNMTGECVETENVDGVNSLTISNNLLSGGLYFYQVIDNAGTVLDGKKFVVQ